MKATLYAAITAATVLCVGALRAQEGVPAKVTDKMIEALINAVTPEADEATRKVQRAAIRAFFGSQQGYDDMQRHAREIVEGEPEQAPDLQPNPDEPTSSVVAMQITGGELAGQRLDANGPRIVVEPGAPIRGRVSLSVRNDMHGNAIAPLAATPTWGEPERSVWEIERWVKTGTTSHDASVNLIAPEAPGTYYIVFALAGTYNVAQIMSGTHPGWTADWAKGNNVAKQSPRVFRRAMAQGWVPFSWYSPEGPKNGTMAMTAVEVVVRGAQIRDVRPVSQQGSKRVPALRCLSCGKLNELDSKFCQGCGGRL